MRIRCRGTDAAAIAEKTIRKTFGRGDGQVIGYSRARHHRRRIVRQRRFVALSTSTIPISARAIASNRGPADGPCRLRDGGRSGRDLIEAMVAGYEASRAINDAISS